MFDKTLIVQFKVTGNLGTVDEFMFRMSVESGLDVLLATRDLGECDGGQQGAGTMELFLYVDDIQAALPLVIDYLTQREYIGFCKIASLAPEGKGYEVHYPAGATFSMWEF